MAHRKDRVMTLPEAVASVTDGSTVVLGGCFNHNKPMAVVRELVRQGRKNLTVVAPPTGSMDVDLLVGAGATDHVVSAYVGFEHLGLAPHFRARCQAGDLKVWECDELHLMVALEAAARCSPCGLTRAGLGTDLPRLNPELRVIADPFTGEPVIAVRALRADVAFLHVQEADPFGNARHLGSVFGDVLIAQAVKRQGGKVFVTVDRLVHPGTPGWDPRQVTLPHMLVDGVIEVPFGAHPTSSHSLYLSDEEHFRRYLAAARSPEGWQAYLEEFVHGPADQADYLERCGGVRRMMALGGAAEWRRSTPGN